MEKSIKVGIFVLAGLVLGGIAVFLVGENRHLWSSKATYRAAFSDVAGLKPGAPVRMGGVDIGTVESVGHDGDPHDTRIYVRFNVVKNEAARVREDTVARVVNKGLLGDKMIELSSDGKLGPLATGQTLKTEEPLDVQKYLGMVEDLATKAGKAIENIEQGTRPFSEPQFSEDVRVTMHSVREIVEGIARNDSAAHRALLDPHEGPKFDRMMTNLEQTTADLHDMTTHLREGPGIAHALVYDGEMSRQASGSMSEVHKDLEAIRTGNGLAHALIYGDTNSQHLMGNVNAMSDDLRDIVAGIKQGKGTIGALLVDPSVYEDIKGIVGNVDRNQVLRALVRYSIKADETRAVPKVDGVK
ncbi:MAG TPA: MlaD family protein [Polyangiaceae bacterium]|nr:MlaD family protein [Polyangiaceae bacterium]